MSTENPTMSGEKVIELTPAERIESLEARKREIEVWMNTSGKSARDAEEIDKINAKIEELKKLL